MTVFRSYRNFGQVILKVLCISLFTDVYVYVQPFSAIPNRNSKDFLFSPGSTAFRDVLADC